MAHLRERRIERQIKNELRWSPIVGVYGLRQVGKTTLAEQVVQQFDADYETLDDPAKLQAAQAAPMGFCERSNLLCIDEAQRSPEIFPAIKRLVGTRRKPGQFFLTGSIRFTLKKEVQESLTGRILLHELLPFNCSEVKKIQISPFLQTALKIAEASDDVIYSRKLIHALSSKGPRLTLAELNRFAVSGGMPIPVFSRDSNMRIQWMQAYFETLISRDLKLVDNTLEEITIREGITFLRYVAGQQGKEISISDLALASTINRALAKRFLRALEALCLIETIVPERIKKKAVGKSKIEWKDFGLWSFFMGQRLADFENDQALELFLSQEFRTQLGSMDHPLQWTFYKSRDLARIPWIFRDGLSSAIAIMLSREENPAPMQYRALKRFVQENKHAVGFILGPPASSITLLDKRLWLLPYPLVF